MLKALRPLFWMPFLTLGVGGCVYPPQPPPQPQPPAPPSPVYFPSPPISPPAIEVHNNSTATITASPTASTASATAPGEVASDIHVNVVTPPVVTKAPATSPEAADSVARAPKPAEATLPAVEEEPTSADTWVGDAVKLFNTIRGQMGPAEMILEDGVELAP